MTAGGIGITLVPALAAPTEISGSTGLVARALAGEPSRTLALGWRRSTARKADFRAFGRYLADIIAKAPQLRP